MVKKQRQKKWILFLLVILLVSACLRAPFTAVGALIDLIQKDTGLSGTLGGLLTSLPMLAFAFIAPVIPAAVRKWGMIRTLFLSMAGLTAGIFVRSLVPGIFGLLAGTAVVGIAIAAGNVILPSFIQHRFRQRTGLMTGVYLVSMALWAGLSSGFSLPLAEGGHLGWKGSLLMWCLLSVLALIALFPLLREEIGRSGESVQEKGDEKPAGSIWRSGLAWFVTFYMGTQSILFYTVLAWLPSMLNEQGLSMSQGGLLLLVIQLISLPTSFLAPILAARSEGQTKLAVSTGVLYVIAFGGLLSGHWILLWSILIGLSSGASFSFAISLFNLRTNTAEESIKLSGMAQSVGYLMAAVSPVITGYIHDLSGSWQAAKILLFICAVLLTALAFIVGRDRKIRLRSVRGQS
ncbi:MFS transporter [Sporolactobacillus sp. CQH2019]|uniref:CynX/NimT family MFS transporter n=1 Tax=Sporolactobacillus sp. CQH2019 TaxID=3023512 RepID=UPI00236895D4|nr:MFS transporter [Sporolactobacillus sp. CQH2019]MDD9150625.1 MFS transporter [Sporolactobacillus sp. CQH2019]